MRDERHSVNSELPAPTLAGHPDNRFRTDEASPLVFRVGPYAFREGDKVAIVSDGGRHSRLGETDLVAVAPMAGHLSTIGNIDVEVSMDAIRDLPATVHVHAEVTSRGESRPRSRSSTAILLTVDS